MKQTIEVPAFEWDNSVKIEVSEIKDVRKTALVGGYNNQEKIWEGLTKTPVSVSIYEQRNRYHYLVKVGVQQNLYQYDTYCYSTEKRCNKNIVARYIASVLDGTYDAEE